MKQVLFLTLLLSSAWAFAEEEWKETTISDEVIHKIQLGQYNYKKCVMEAMRKPGIADMESRHATDTVIKDCEPTLSEMRKIYTDADVPGAIADRHLKKLRIQVTRNILQELMYAEAAKKSGQTQPQSPVNK